MSSGSSSSNSNNNSNSNNKKHKTIINNLKRNTKTKNDRNNDSKEAARKKTYRSHHTDYRPFVRYIEHHSGIDDETVEKAKRRFGILGSNSKSNSNSNNNSNSNTFGTNTPTNQESNTMNQGNAFGDQRNSALTKKERDDARHADLHANYKAKNFTDADKIFLLKREIDGLRENARDPGGGTGGSARASYASSLPATPSAHRSFLAATPVFTLLLVAGVLLAAARWTRHKLRVVRAEASLLAAAALSPRRRAAGGAGEHESGHATVELRESTLFASMAESWASDRGESPGGGGDLFSYRAPEQPTNETTVEFV